MPHDDPASRLAELLDGAERRDDEETELVELLDLADVVRRRPADRFRAALRLDLERNIAMTTTDPDAPTLDVAPLSGISYMHIPALDARRSADFYVAVFGWELRGDPDHPSFNDGTGHVIGAWDTDLPPATEGGVLPYVFVESVDEILERVIANGCAVVREPYPEGELWVTTFRDPAGNVIGAWQSGPRRRG